MSSLCYWCLFFVFSSFSTWNFPPISQLAQYYNFPIVFLTFPGVSKTGDQTDSKWANNISAGFCHQSYSSEFIQIKYWFTTPQSMEQSDQLSNIHHHHHHHNRHHHHRHCDCSQQSSPLPDLLLQVTFSIGQRRGNTKEGNKWKPNVWNADSFAKMKSQESF